MLLHDLIQYFVSFPVNLWTAFVSTAHSQVIQITYGIYNYCWLQMITKQDEQIQELQNAIIRTKTVLPKVFPCD
jgi:hypothetical protein